MREWEDMDIDVVPPGEHIDRDRQGRTTAGSLASKCPESPSSFLWGNISLLFLFPIISAVRFKNKIKQGKD